MHGERGNHGCLTRQRPAAVNAKMCFSGLGEHSRFAAALLLLAGCSFDPSGLTPGGGVSADGGAAPDSGAPADGPVAEMDAGVQAPDAGAQAPDAGESPQRRKQITIRASEVDAPGNGALEDFPVLFSVIDEDIRGRASADGSDIYFVASDGASRLEHEIEKWDADTGELVAWVKVPALSASDDTVFFVYYGDPDAADETDPAAVWSSGFAAVWHLAQDPGPGTPGGIRDSAADNHGTTEASMQPGDLVPGRIGDAIDFDGDDDEITFENPITGGTPHTISVWVNQRDTNSQDALVVLGSSALNQARWFHGVWFGGTVATGFYNGGEDWNTGIDIEAQGWTLLHWVYDGTRSRMYRDGELEPGQSTMLSDIDTQGGEGRLGNARSPAFGQDMNLNGQLDEVRIATVVRSAEWIRTEHRNQSDPAAFYTVADESQ